LVIVGVGNILLQDEGVGIHLIQALKEVSPLQGDHVELIDAGTVLPPLPGNLDKLIIVDAAQGGGEPGTIYRLSPDEIDNSDAPIISPHQLSLGESLRLTELENDKPKEVIIFGVEPKTIDWGLELSPELKEKIPQLIGLVLQEAGIK
jgi:hydrogenase maturation protease